MNNTYTIREASLKDALDHIDSFQEKMKVFSDKYPRFSYSVNIEKDEDQWLIELNIKTKDEQRNTQIS